MPQMPFGSNPFDGAAQISQLVMTNTRVLLGLIRSLRDAGLLPAGAVSLALAELEPPAQRVRRERAMAEAAKEMEDANL